jgi:poly(A) polymerase
VVVDYHNGLKDAKSKTLRMIGDPVTRYREDPVRIIRAVRFAAKLSHLGFKLESKTAAPIQKSIQLLDDVPQSRLFDEMLKLLQTGHSLASIAQLQTLGVARGIYPLLDLVVERARLPLVDAVLHDTDRRVGEGKPVAPSFLLACVLWPDVRDGWNARLNAREHSHPALQDAIEDVFNNRIGDVSGRGKLAGDMREIWMLQPRFEKRTGSAPFGLLDQPRFRAGFDFMRLRADIGEVDEALVDWWQEFSTGDADIQQDLIEQLRQEQAKRPRAPRVQRAPQPEGTTARLAAPDSQAAAPQGDTAEPGSDGEAPKKRRRRRTGGKGDGGGSSGGTPPPE